MSFPNQFQENSELLRAAKARGIVNLSLCFHAPPFRLMKVANKSPVPRASIQNIDQNTQALRTKIHTFERTDVLSETDDHLIELARITVPEGNVGHVRCIEQYMADSEGRFYASASNYWGQPYNETVPIDDVVWLFRLSTFDGSWSPQFYQSAAPLVDFRAILPGAPWWDLPEFRGIWYPATHRKGFSGTIPSGMQLRMFAFMPSSSQEFYRWRLSGRLTARVQSELCQEARANTRFLQ